VLEGLEVEVEVEEEMLEVGDCNLETRSGKPPPESEILMITSSSGGPSTIVTRMADRKVETREDTSQKKHRATTPLEGNNSRIESQSLTSLFIVLLMAFFNSSNTMYSKCSGM